MEKQGKTTSHKGCDLEEIMDWQNASQIGRQHVSEMKKKHRETSYSVIDLESLFGVGDSFFTKQNLPKLDILVIQSTLGCFKIFFFKYLKMTCFHVLKVMFYERK